jgi:hypothetical protein
MWHNPFDELASNLASGRLSRRRALRLLGAALVGSALAFIPGVARARGVPPPYDVRVRCGIGAYNVLVDCANTAGDKFSCSESSSVAADPYACTDTAGARFECKEAGSIPGGLTLYCDEDLLE